jgi:hypothetical protein
MIMNIFAHLRRSLCAAALFLLLAPAGAEVVRQNWAVRYNGPGDNADESKAVGVDAAGNVFITGASTGTTSGSDYYTAKYSPSGQTLWAVRYNGLGNGNDTPNALVVDADGNVIVTGVSYSGTSTDDDIYTAKYRGSDGALIWERRFAGSGSASSKDVALAIAVDRVGDLAIAGYTGTNSDYYVAKYSCVNGVTLWEQRFTGGGSINGSEKFVDVAFDKQGNVFCTGFGPSDTASSTFSEYVTVKYAGVTGAQVWLKRFNNASTGDSDEATALAVDSAGNVIVTGYSIASSDNDIYTVKYAGADGAEIWGVRIQGSGVKSYDRPQAIVVDASDNIYVGGRMAGDGCVFKLAGESGGVSWLQTGTAAAHIYSLAIDQAGQVVAAGYFFGSTNRGDYRLARLSASSGEILWEAGYDGAPHGEDSLEGIKQLAILPDGGVVVAGSSSNSSSPTFASKDIVTVRFSLIAPAPTTSAASAISFQSATLAGTVNPNGAPASAWFEYGTSTAFGSTTPVQAIPTGASAVPVTRPLTGLKFGTAYYYRLVANNENNVPQFGPTLSFDTLADTTPPVITLNGAAEITLEAPATYAEPGATAQDAIWGARTVQISGTVFGNTPGDYPISYFSVDGSGNAAFASRMVHIVDTAAPVLTLNGAAQITWEAGGLYGDPGAMALDASAGMVMVSLSGGVNVLLPADYTLTYTANDGHGNTVTAIRQVKVVDTTAPLLVLPAAPVVEAVDGGGAIVVYGIIALDTVDPSPIVSAAPVSGSRFPLGVTTVAVEAADAAGNVRTESFTVTVQDTTKPVIAGNFAPRTLATGADGTVPLPNFVPQAVAADAVSMPLVAQGPPAGTPVVTGTSTVTLTATDADGNAQTVSFEVQIADGTIPAIAAPDEGFGPLRIVAGPQGTVELPDYTGQAVTSDNVAVTGITQTPTAGTVLSPGETVVGLKVVDAAGNENRLNFTVNVVDEALPEIGAPEANFAPLTLTTGENGTAALPDYTSQAVTGDNVEVTSVAQSPAPGSPREAGTTTVKLTAADAGGNTRDITFEVTVLDGTSPSIVAPETGFVPRIISAGADGFAPLPDYTTQAVTGDNVGVAAVTQVPEPGSIRRFGKTLVTLTAIDAAGNSSETSFEISVALERALVAPLAASGGPVPGAGEDPRIPAGAVFTTFGLPAVDDARGVAFLAQWKSGAVKGAGIFAGAPVKLIAAAGDDAPGVSGAIFKSFQDPLLAPGGGLAFYATLQGDGVLASSDHGVWMTTGTGLALVLREGTSHKTLSGLSLRDGELLAAVTLLPLPDLVSKTNDSVLLSVTPTSSKILLQEGAPITLDPNRPASPVKTLSLLVPGEGSPAQGRMHGDGEAIVRVELQDKRLAILHIAPDGTITPRLQTGRLAPIPGANASWTGFGIPALGREDAGVVVKAELKGGVPVLVSPKNDSVLAFDAGLGDGFKFFAREGDPAPGGEDAIYAKFADPLLNDRGDVAFTAMLAGQGVATKNKTGLWWGKPEAPGLATRLGAVAPDADGLATSARFSKFISLALPDGPGAAPIFVANVAGQGVTTKTNTGLWAVDPSGHLRQLLRTGDLVEGQPIVGLHALAGATGSLGAARGFNAVGTLTIRVLLPRGQQAILQIEIPDGK